MGENIAITYETLFEMLRNEKNRDELQRLNPNFVDEVSSYINDKRNSLNEQLSLYSDDEKIKANRQLTNLKSILRELYEKRERKIIAMALNKSRTDAIIDTSLMLSFEKEMFDKLLELFNENRKEFMKNTFEQTKKIEIKKVVVEDDEDDEDNEDEVETKLIRFLAPVPKFMGKELEVYGPFEEEDVASLPLEIAELLIKKGRAEELSED
jgi:DNA replication initiation complex subunit (GINS family)